MARGPLTILAMCAAIEVAPMPLGQWSEVRQLIDLGRWPSALRAAQRESDPIARARACVEVLFGAGDLGGALEVAREGLRSDPNDLVLLWRMAQISIDLRLGSVAAESVGRLERALVVTRPRAEDRDWWDSQLRSLRESQRDLSARESEIEAATQRARWTVVLGLGAWGIALAVLARRA